MPLFFQQSTAAGALTTYMFHLALTAGGADATGKTPVVNVSKAGGAFGAAAGVITEVSSGWYKIVFTAADLGTLGTLTVLVTEASSVTVRDELEVVAFNPFDAAALGLTGMPVSSASVTSIQSGLATGAEVAANAVVKNKTVAMGTISGSSGNSSGVSAKNAVSVVVTVTGTFGGGTAQPQVCADPTAASPVWVNSGSGLTSNGSKTISGPVNAVRVNLSGATGASVICTAEVSVPVASN